MKTILVTGATGFVGKNIVQHLTEVNARIIILSRRNSLEQAKSLFPEFQVECHELEKIDDLLTIKKNFLNEITDVVHVAGGYDIEMSEVDSYMSNVVLTQNLLFLTTKMKNLSHFHLISSFSVIGKNKSVNVNFEHELGAVKNITNYYSKGKMLQESICRNFVQSKGNFKLRIYRPGIVVETRPGMKPGKIDGPLYFLKFLKKYHQIARPLMFSFFPFSKGACLPLISVHVLARQVVEAVTSPVGNERIKSYYLLNKKSASLKKFLKDSLGHYGMSFPLVPVPRKILPERLIKLTGLPKELTEYLYFCPNFDFTTRDEDFPNWKDESLTNWARPLIESMEAGRLE